MLRPALIVFLLTPVAAHATPLPEPVRAMIDAALRSGKASRAEAVVAVARETHPESLTEIDAMVSAYHAEEAIAQEEALAKASLLDNWTGSGEVGGSFATGNSDTVTVAVGINLVRDTPQWQHRFTASADLQRSDGSNSQERYSVSYQPNWKLSDRTYLFGRVGWERNRVSGLKSRFAEAFGVGYQVLEDGRLNWQVEAGPSLRQSDFYDRHENSAAIRLASNFAWEINPNTTFTQNTSGIFETDNSSIASLAAITSKLWGPMSARLSVNMLYESNPPDDLRKLDTVTRATLVYEFGGS
ncbi:MAG: DUF481 domain-containing protein [Sphingomonadaceae bacterium]